MHLFQNARQRLIQRRFQSLLADSDRQVVADKWQPRRNIRLAGKGDFALFRAAYQAVAKPLTPDLEQQRDLVCFTRVANQIVQQTTIRATVKIALRRDVVNRDGVPPRQHRQGDTFFGFAAHAQQRHQIFKGQRDIQIVSAHAATAVPQQAVFTIGALTPLRPHQQHGAVGGAAANIHDQHTLLFPQRSLVVQARRNRFVLEYHLLKTGAFCRPLQNTLRLAVRVIAAQSLKVDRATDHCLGNGLRQLAVRRMTNMYHHGAD
ncbi:Uncharacterised protein [Salmonella enterica subsp. enterica serovar Bovismorbificans]|nr:Uncharacterised protein [Salmonella enterica subsp. enterica serovar Bovismorbificans]